MRAVNYYIVIEKKVMVTEKKIKKFKTIKQHFVNSIINYDKYDNIVEEIINVEN